MPKYWVKNYFAHGRFPEVGQKQKTEKKKKKNTPGTAGGPGGRDRTLPRVAWRTQSRLGQLFYVCIYLSNSYMFSLHEVKMNKIIFHR